MRNNQPITQQEYTLADDATLMSTTDPNSYITYANASFIEASGFTAEEIIKQPHNVVRHPDMPPQVFADMWATLKQGEPWTGLVKNRRKNGGCAPTQYRLCVEGKPSDLCRSALKPLTKK